MLLNICCSVTDVLLFLLDVVISGEPMFGVNKIMSALAIFGHGFLLRQWVKFGMVW